MYKRGYSKRGLISLICAILVLGLGCGGEEQSEPEATPAHREQKRVQATARPQVRGTEIGGQISKDTTLSLKNSPYILSQNLEVLLDVTLTIEPGVIIKGAAYTAIVVRGNLHAIGKADKRIKFTSLRKGDKWDGIQLKDESFDYESDELIEGYGCVIQYCEIENANTGIYCKSVSPLISNNIIQNGGEGITCRDSANPIIINNLIKDNSDGISCSDYSSPEIKYNTVIGNDGRGISCSTYSAPLIVYNTIFGSGETWWTGIVCQNSSAPKVNHNNIYSNGGYNLKQVQTKPGDESLTIDARNNWWGVSDKAAVAATIFDKANKSTLGKVNFIPFIKNKIQSANHLGQG